jgi:hypothetical protein
VNYYTGRINNRAKAGTAQGAYLVTNRLYYFINREVWIIGRDRQTKIVKMLAYQVD